MVNLNIDFLFEEKGNIYCPLLWAPGGILKIVRVHTVCQSILFWRCFHITSYMWLFSHLPDTDIFQGSARKLPFTNFHVIAVTTDLRYNIWAWCRQQVSGKLQGKKEWREAWCLTKSPYSKLGKEIKDEQKWGGNRVYRIRRIFSQGSDHRNRVLIVWKWWSNKCSLLRFDFKQNNVNLER